MGNPWGGLDLHNTSMEPVPRNVKGEARPRGIWLTSGKRDMVAKHLRKEDMKNRVTESFRGPHSEVQPVTVNKLEKVYSVSHEP